MSALGFNTSLKACTPLTNSSIDDQLIKLLPGMNRIVVIVIVISTFLKRYSKAKRTRAPAYSRALIYTWHFDTLSVFCSGILKCNYSAMATFSHFPKSVLKHSIIQFFFNSIMVFIDSYIGNRKVHILARNVQCIRLESDL